MFKDLVYNNRSCRRFYGDYAIARETLLELVDLARCTASGGNRQPLKYILSCEPEKNALVFELIRFARKDSRTPYPPEGERPSAYIIILLDTDIVKTAVGESGIAAQTILLGAREKGLGGCMVGLVARHEMMLALDIPVRYQIVLVIALGKPKEEAVIEPLGKNINLKASRDNDGVRRDNDFQAYWDEAGVRRVPKRLLDDIIIASYGNDK